MVLGLEGDLTVLGPLEEGYRTPGVPTVVVWTVQPRRGDLELD